MKGFLNIIAVLFFTFAVIAVINVFVNVFEDANKSSNSYSPEDPKVKAAEITYEIADPSSSAYSVTTPVSETGTATYTDNDMVTGFLAWKDSKPGQIRKAEIIPDTYFDEDAQFLKRLNVAENGLIEGNLNIGGHIKVEGESTFEEKVTIDEGEVEINSVEYYFPDTQAPNGSYILSNDGSGTLSWESVYDVGAGDITAVIAGGGLIGGALSGDATFDIGAGNGILVNANDIGINLSTTVGAGSTASLSGLEVDGNGLRLLRGCGQAEILVWDDANDIWECASIVSAGGVTGTGTDNYIPRWNGADDLESSGIYQTDSGSIGIGTTAPAFSLDVAGTGRFTGQVQIDNVPVVADNNLVLTDSSGIVSSIDSTNWDKNSSDDFSGFAETDNRLARFDATGTNIEDSSINDEYAGGVAVSIDSAGQVGIGTTSPVSTFSVGASSQFQVDATGNIIKLNNVTTSFPSLQGDAGSILTNDGAGTLTWGSPSGTGTLGYWQRNGTNLAPANIGDRVGIGTTAPSQELDIVGDINLNTNGTSALFSTYKGANSNGDNIWIGNGGQSSIGQVGMLVKGSANTAIGISALLSSTTGYYNSALGRSALYSNTSGFGNSAVGRSSLFSNQSGYQNSAVGYQALYWNNSGYDNSAVGMNALYSNTGYQNSVVGGYTLYYNTSGYRNVALGYGAGVRGADGIIANQTPNNSVYLGYDTRALADGDTNEIVIGSEAIGVGSNSAVLGNDSITKTILKGSVGIGTTSPQYALDVNGDIGIATGSDLFIGNIGLGTTESNTSTGAYLVGAFDEFTYSDGTNVQAVLADLDTAISGVGGITGTGVDNYIPIWNGTDDLLTSEIYQTDGGLIGIGTTGPGDKLDVAGRLRFSNDSTWPGANIASIYRSASTGLSFTGNTASEYSFYFANNLGNDVMYNPVGTTVMSFAGDVGVGTTDPSTYAKLDVTGGIRGEGALFVDRVDGAITNYFQVGMRGAAEAGNFGNALGNGQTEIFTYGTSGIVFGPYDAKPLVLATSNAERMRITGAGLVGIGITSPGAKLDILGDNNDEVLTVRSSSGTINFYPFSDNKNYIESGNAAFNASQLLKFTGVGGGDGTFQFAGTVGIGTLPSASYGLNVVGGNISGIYSSSSVTGVTGYASTYGVRGIAENALGIGMYGSGGTIGVQGAGVSCAGCYDFYAIGSAVDYGTSSSIRWKSDLKPIDNALDKVLSMRGLYYTWDEEHGGRRDMGMIAEEVGQVVPEIVGWDRDAPGYATGMDYGHLTPVLVEAIKEQQLQINNLSDLKLSFNDSGELLVNNKIVEIQAEQTAQRQSIKEILVALLRMDTLESSLSAVKDNLDLLAERLNKWDEVMEWSQETADSFASLIFKVPTVFSEIAIFEAPIKVNADTSETIEIPEGTLKAKITFTKKFPEKPSIYVNFVGTTPVDYELVDVSVSGFSISFTEATSKNFEIQWLAILRNKSDNSPSVEIFQSDSESEPEISDPVVDEEEAVEVIEEEQNGIVPAVIIPPVEESSESMDPSPELVEEDEFGISQEETIEENTYAGIEIGGVVLIKAGETTAVVETSELSESSTIEVSTQDDASVAAKVVENGKFEIALDQTYEYDVNVTWVIIN